MLAELPRLDGRALPATFCNTETKAPIFGWPAATSDPAAFTGQREACWGAVLLGVATGAESGFDVLDLDGPRHPEAARWLVTHHDRLPLTRVHATRSGGQHWGFQHDPRLRNWVGRPVIGIDVRTTGSGVVWWPAHGFPVRCDVPIAPWPDWLLAVLLRQEKRGVGVFHPSCEGDAHLPPRRLYPWSRECVYAMAALNNAGAELQVAREGERNHKLNVMAYKMGRLVARGWIEAEHVAQWLGYSAKLSGLGSDEISKTIRSGLTAGVAEPYPDLPPPHSSTPPNNPASTNHDPAPCTK